jgi:hypothetical protein
MFLNRKKFNLINWIKNTKNVNYELFCNFLESRNVITPGLDYFNKALDFYDKNVMKKETKEFKPVKETKVVKKEKTKVEEVKVEEVKESFAEKIVQLKEIVEKKAALEEEEKVEEPPVKKTRRRRRTKKS